MKRSLFLLALFLSISSCHLIAQCDAYDTLTYINSYALRTTADDVYTYSQTWTSGPDAPYDYIWTYQDDYINGNEIDNQLVGSASPGNVAWAERTSYVDVLGFGECSTQAAHITYDSCTDAWMPPYLSGIIDGMTYANVWAYQPAISGNSRFWIHNYGDGYPTTTTWSAITGGAPEVPAWYFSGNDNHSVNLSCSVCNSVTLSAGPGAMATCSTSVTGYFQVGHLKSPAVGVLIDGATQRAANSPSSGQHVDNNAVIHSCPITSGALSTTVKQLDSEAELSIVPVPCRNSVGYSSVWYWQIVDVCGTPMYSVNMHEEFPNGFVYAPSNANSNWPFPTANSWQAGTDGGWNDAISEVWTWLSKGIPTGVPMPSLPESPLGTNLVYSGLQNVYVGNAPTDSEQSLVFSAHQAHYQDHGGYTDF